MCRTAGCAVTRLRRTVVGVVYVGMKVNPNEKSERPWSSARGRLELLAVVLCVGWKPGLWSLGHAKPCTRRWKDMAPALRELTVWGWNTQSCQRYNNGRSYRYKWEGGS